MQKRFCDRCEDQMHDTSDRPINQTRGYSVVAYIPHTTGGPYGGPTQRPIDLCPLCRDALTDWLVGA